MDNQHKAIVGYRDLTKGEILRMNAGKELAEKVGAWIEELQADPSLDQRWVNIGATQLQQGFMAAIRGVARPTTF